MVGDGARMWLAGRGAAACRRERVAGRRIGWGRRLGSWGPIYGMGWRGIGWRGMGGRGQEAALGSRSDECAALGTRTGGRDGEEVGAAYKGGAELGCEREREAARVAACVTAAVPDEGEGEGDGEG